MGNMGTIPATGYESSVVQTFSSPTGTSHTMTYAANVSDMVLVINNVIQEPTVAYTTSGTTLTTATLVSGDTMYIIYLALSRKTVTPGANTVTNAMMVNDSVDETKLKNNLGMAFTEVVVTAADSLLLCDATDSGNNKRDTVQGLLDLVSGLQVKTAFTTRAKTSTGTQTISGVGFTPLAVFLVACRNSNDEMSVGFSTGSAQGVVYDDNQSVSDTWGSSSANAVHMGEDGGTTNFKGAPGNFGSDGFDIVWTDTGSPAGTCTFIYLAIA